MISKKSQNNLLLEKLLEKKRLRINKMSREYESFNDHLKIIEKFDLKFEREFEKIKKLRNIKFEVNNQVVDYDHFFNDINMFNIILGNYKDEINMISLDVGYLIYDYIKSVIYCSFDFLMIIESEMKRNNFNLKEVYESLSEINKYLYNFANNLLILLNKKINKDLISEKYINKNVEDLLEHNLKYVNSINSRSFSIFAYFSDYLNIIRKTQDSNNDKSYFEKIPTQLINLLNKFHNDIDYFLNYSKKLILESLEIEEKMVEKFKEIEKLIETINYWDLNSEQKKIYKKIFKQLDKKEFKEIEVTLFDISKNKKKQIMRKVKQKFRKVDRNLSKEIKKKPKNIENYEFK